jgi:hypothetical protein
VWRKKTMPVPPTKEKNRPTCLLNASLRDASWASTKKCNAGCDESLVHECVIGVDNCGCECESETWQAIGCVHYVSVLLYCVRASSSFVCIR